MASTSTSRSAPGTHKRDTSTVVMVGGVPVKRPARTLPYSGSWSMSVTKVRILTTSGQAGTVSGQNRRDVVHDEIRLGGRVIAADDFAVRVDGDLAGQLQEGPVAELDARYVGVRASRGGNGSWIIENDHDVGPLPGGVISILDGAGPSPVSAT